jgi:AcrR family transcriptional regulator
MADPVKPKRSYDSPRRREQAAATRLEILEAAQRLFERNGYPGTTMAAIAAEARVALKTVYVAFETKSGVLRALWNLRLRGGREDIPVGRQETYREVLEEPDPERQLRLNARNSRAGKGRVGTVAEVIRGAAPLDADIEALWDRINSEYHANQGVIVESLHSKGALKPGLEVKHATDILWAINHPSTWQMLVVQRAWTPEEYEQWSAAAACSQLLAAGRG